jgi:tripartite-type tricarboxylate transporter receptor subunit TctC
MGSGLSTRLGQRVVIENHITQRAIEAMDMAARAAPDGYTLILGDARTHVLAPLALELGYDPAEDFDPVTQVAIMPYVLATPASTKVESVSQLIALARTRPLSYSSAGDPLGYLAMQMLKTTTGVNATQSVRWGRTPLAELLQKVDVDMVFASAGGVLPHVNSRALRAIAVSSVKRAAAFPSVPTLAESGYAGFDLGDWFAVFVPRGTPAEIIHRLHVELANVAANNGVTHAIRQTGAEPFTSVSNIEVLKRMRSESAKYGKVMAKVNFKPGGSDKRVPGPAKSSLG